MTKTLIPVLARVFVSSTWYDLSGIPNRRKVYAKTRELIIGDRAEMLALNELTKEASE